MIGYTGLIQDFVDRINGSTELPLYLQDGFVVETERVADDTTLPTILVQSRSAFPWSNQSFRGTQYQVQVSVFFPRQEQGSIQGIDDIGIVMEILRDLLEDVDGIDLPSRDGQGGNLIIQAQDSRYEERTQPRLIMRQFVNALLPTTDPDGRFIQGSCRFICLVGIR